MEKQYYIELSRKDVGLVSYCPGFEIKDAPGKEWIREVLMPAITPIASRRSKKIRQLPITFWIAVRETARRRAEIFLFVTPSSPGSLIEEALSRALDPLKNGKVNAGREPLPVEAVPCGQIFRNQVIRFHWKPDKNDSGEWFTYPAVYWKDNVPEIQLIPFQMPRLYSKSTSSDVPYEESKYLPVEARILGETNGDECRKLQQALTCGMMETPVDYEKLPEGSRRMECPGIESHGHTNGTIDLNDLWR